jgi:hypothetical protein
MRNKFATALLVLATALPLFAKEIKHRFLICNYIGQAVQYVDQFDSSKNWTIKPGFSSFDIQLIGDNKLMICHDNGYHVYDLNTREKVKKFLLPRPRNAYMALYAPDGGSVYVSGGYSKGFYTFDAEGKLLKDTVIKQPEGLNNYFYGGFQILKNGHIVMCNWTGHNQKDYKPGLKMVEFDKDHNVVWSWNENLGGTVNQIIVMDELDPMKLNEETSGVLQ